MTDGNDDAQFGWKSLSKFVGCSMRTLYRDKKELRACGAISDPVWRGRKPNRKRIIRWWPRVVMAYYTRKNIEELEDYENS